MLGEDVDCRGVVGAVARVQSLHLGHAVEEEAAHPLLVLRQPVKESVFKECITCRDEMKNK